jgi:cell volume regulation protein A
MDVFDRSIWIAGLLLLLSVVASKFSGKFGIPSLLFFLILGILTGLPPIGLRLWDPELAQSLAVLALIFILFGGGLDMNWPNVRRVLFAGVSLATLGVFISMVAVALFVHWLTPFTLMEGLLLGAIVSPTDASAVFATLRSSRTKLPVRVTSTLELESGSNDPMSAFLTLAVTALLLSPHTSASSLIPSFFWQMVTGGVLGFVFGFLTVGLINRLRLDFEGLYSPLMIAMVLLNYATAGLVEANGFLAVFVQGLYVGNGRFYRKQSLLRFQDGLAWIMQIMMFIALGLIVRPQRVLQVAPIGTAIALFLIFVARPLSTLVALAFSKLRFREQLLVSWAGLRGAVPIILATFPLLSGVGRASEIFDIVFYIVIFSVLVQGATLTKVPKLLRLPAAKPHEDEQLRLSDRGELQEFQVPTNAVAVGRSVMELGFPSDVVILLIGRENGMFIPTGRTTIEPNDVLFVLSEPDRMKAISHIFQPKKTEH